MFHRLKALLSASWIAIGLQASPAAAAVDVFWIPIAAGTTWSFLESGSWSDSQGGRRSHRHERRAGRSTGKSFASWPFGSVLSVPRAVG